ncbi:winged helix-turn-helix transcriptional regulator [Candidatus Micrarchaeota archaeon]|nr:winged helix-turn-helix transcriptional regulator [Candidatus Micrarchaeota archaeon]
MGIKLDYYDKKILFELDKNSRIRISELAKKIKKSKQFVNYRIKKLEETGIILGYNTVIDYSKLGYTSIRVYLKFHNITPQEQQEVENDLINDGEVWWLVTLEGMWDVGYAVAVRNILDFHSYWDRIMKKYRKFVSRSSVVVYTNIKQYPKAYLIGEENTGPGTIVGASTNIVKVDKADLSILKLLSENARTPLIEMAATLKASPQSIRSRIKKLEEKGIIQGYRAKIDVSLLGYRYYKAYIDLRDTRRFGTLEEFCLRHPNILNTNRTIGGKDFEIELQASSFDEFERIMNSIRERFSGDIDEYEFVVARKEMKMKYLPFKT